MDNFSVTELAAALKNDRPALISALKDTIQNLNGERSDALENLTPHARKRVDALTEIQSQLDELVAKFREERAVLEAKYQKLYQPLYAKRYEIVNGFTKVELANGNTKVNQGEDKTTEDKGVPSFWLTALLNNKVTCEEVTERDEEALKYLQDIKWCRIEKFKGFKLEFLFDKNPYFKNTVLTKSYHIDEDIAQLDTAIGTKIDWYPGKCLTQKILMKKPKKGSKNSKLITEDCDSFFNFFSPPDLPEEGEEIDAERAAELQDLLEQDYDIGTTIRDRIIPRAVSWYTGEALESKNVKLDDDKEAEEEIAKVFFSF